MDGTQVVEKSFSQQTVAKTLSDIMLRTDIPSSTAVPSVSNSPLRANELTAGRWCICRQVRSFRLRAVELNPGSRSSTASGSLLLPRSCCHPGDLRIVLVPPRRVDHAARLLQAPRTCQCLNLTIIIFSFSLCGATGNVSSRSTQQSGGTTSRPALPLHSARGGNSPGRGHYPAGWRYNVQATTMFLCMHTAGDPPGRCAIFAIRHGPTKGRSNYCVLVGKASHTHFHTHTPEFSRACEGILPGTACSVPGKGGDPREGRGFYNFRRHFSPEFFFVSLFLEFHLHGRRFF